MALCTFCGWTGLISALLVVNEAWVCPQCGSDESALVIDGNTKE